MVKVQINMESLNEAIKDFNSWSKVARIYYNKADNTFETEVFANDVQAVETFNVNENVSVVYSKKETQNNVNVGEKRKEYIIKFTEMLNEGYAAHEAEYHLSDML